VPPAKSCLKTGPSSPEVTRAICLVPSAQFSQAPRYALPVHLCRFRVRSVCGGYFLEPVHGPKQSNKLGQFTGFVTIRWPTNVRVVPIDYGFRPRLRGRLTLRRLALRRNPWTFGGRVFHSPFRYSCQHSRFRYLQRILRCAFISLRNAPLPRIAAPAASVHGLSPVTFSAQGFLFRPVSCYAFFKGWLLLSQPPGCCGILTSFPT
jgi:hypothetical protein